MKNQLIILLISIGLFSSCAPTKADKYNALNDYLDSVVKDTEEIMVIKEKESSDLAIIMFYGNDLYPKYPDTTVVIRENGIQGHVLGDKGWSELFDKKDWSKMKKKYGCKKGDSLTDSGRWNADDFRHKNIVFENWKVFLKGLASGKYYDSPEQKVFHLSHPIVYKKKYLVFSVVCKSTQIYLHDDINSTVVMEKVNDKWIVIAGADPGYFN